jgi:hypothetical protein
MEHLSSAGNSNSNRYNGEYFLESILFYLRGYKNYIASNTGNWGYAGMI